MAYVGPPDEYDLMGATQFRLLCALGLRAHHRLLDFGCGSLRAGRLFISYLDEGRYFGIDPNGWLIEDAVRQQLGQEVLSLKKPRFDHNPHFRTNVFGHGFDFMVAQSVFSHCGSDLVSTALRNFKTTLNPRGIIAATFVEGEADFAERGWVYPECVSYLPESIRRLATEAGLSCQRLPWHHPRQTWYLFAADPAQLPPEAWLPHLSGTILVDPDADHPWNRPGLKPQALPDPNALPENTTTMRRPWWQRLGHFRFPFS